MRVQMRKWEVERVKEIVSDILELWAYDSIEASTESGATLSMSSKAFMEALERDLNDIHK